ncbi:multi-sensor hybrid histidine kinase [Candidatus Moduliflexus flocculans]|uniref:histidine kinase n=1 Tax=Candidatus Moduliflexus flocculans TaxID=1499966 RepID=A0A081BQT6_9BACT|nr:multi-sensor hybrid histidine kinase [Candidatus Moduliflexus flocculans]
MQGVPRNILVVEDDLVLAKSIQRQLKHLGHHLTAIAETGEDAVAFAQENTPDVILMDIRLNGFMDGIEAAEEIRRTHDTPIIFMTSHDDEETFNRAKMAEPGGYLLKPFDEANLHIAIEFACYKHDAEKKLRESEARHRNLFQNAPVAMWEDDFSAVKTYFSRLRQQGIQDLTAYWEASPDEVDRCAALIQVRDLSLKAVSLYRAQSKADLLVSLDKIYTPTSRDAIKACLLAFFNGETTFSCETQEINFAQELMYLHVTWMIMPGDESSWEKVVVSTIDLTAQKQMRDEILRAKEEWEQTFDAVPDAIMILDNHHRIIRTNDALNNSLGLSKQQCEGQQCYSIVHGLNMPPLSCVHTHLLHDLQEHRGEIFEEQLGGHCLVTVTPLFDRQHNLIGAVHVSRNINDRKQAEELLKLEEERLHALLTLHQMENVSEEEMISFALEEVVRLTRSDGGYFHFVNPDEQSIDLFAWSKRVLEFCAVETVGHYPIERAGVWADCVRQRAPVIHNDYQHLPEKKGYPEGHFHLVRHMSVPVFDQGKIVAIAGVGNKQTYYDQNDMRQLSLFMNSMWTLLKRRRVESDLLAARKEAERANQAKSEFLATMSHELRTPLNGILGYTQLLRRDARLADDQVRAIETIHRSGEHLLTLLNDILDISKIEAGKIEIQSAPFALQGMLHTLTDMMRMRAEQKGVAFAYDSAPDLPEVIASDEQRLRQILLNLLGNAVKFTERGEVTLRVKNMNQNMPVAAQRQITIRFEVQDTGIGIPAEQLQQIFDPFEQVAAAKFRSEGTGLGLSICRRLAEKMGSRIEVASELGKGSLFWFDLPTQIADLPGSHHHYDSLLRSVKRARPISGVRDRRSQSSRAIRTILLVDDVEQNRIVLKSIFLPLGFTVLEAANGQQALDMAIRFTPDLILMDIVMPGMDGLEATRRLRSVPALAQTPIIAVSASASGKNREACLAAGCNEFLAKPIDVGALLEQVAIFLQIEWLYADEHAASDAPMVAPSRDELAALLHAASIGDIMEIKRRIKHLETIPEFAAFTNTLRTFAITFQLAPMCEFLRSLTPNDSAR